MVPSLLEYRLLLTRYFIGSRLNRRSCQTIGSLCQKFERPELTVLCNWRSHRHFLWLIDSPLLPLHVFIWMIVVGGSPNSGWLLTPLDSGLFTYSSGPAMSEYFIKTTNGERGPLSVSDLRQLVADGKLKPTNLLRTLAMENYAPAGKLKGLFPAVAEEAEPPSKMTDDLREIGSGALAAMGNAASALGSMIPQRKTVESTAVIISPENKIFVADGQDESVVEKLAKRARELSTSTEEIRYIAAQKKPVVNLFPDGIVLTTRRVMILRPKMLGRLEMQDFIWRDLKNVQIAENLMGSTITFTTISGEKTSLDYIPKPQARQCYRIAQEQEERVVEERRQRSMEESRAGASNISINTAVATPASAPVAPANDPMAKLQQLKSMADAGLITPEEFAEKKSAILASF